MPAQVNIPVANVATLLGLGYTTVELWASLNDGGSFEEITASAATAATSKSLVGNTVYRLGGSTLRYAIDGGDEVRVAFENSLSYWTAQQVLDRINSITPGLASLVSGFVVLTSPTTGRGSSLLVWPQDTMMQWMSSGTSYGKDARVPLDSHTLLYEFIDAAGASHTLYKWRFSFNGRGPLSEFGPPAYGVSPNPEDVSMSLAYAHFLGADGRPGVRKVIITTNSTPQKIGSYTITGPMRIEVDSDKDGFFQYPLVQGSTVRIAVEGTNFVREITVPATGSFDILSAMATAPDPFTVSSAPVHLVRSAL